MSKSGRDTHKQTDRQREKGLRYVLVLVPLLTNRNYTCKNKSFEPQDLHQRINKKEKQDAQTKAEERGRKD